MQTTTPTYTLEESNEIIKKYIQTGKRFFIARLSDTETKVALSVVMNIPVSPRQLYALQNNSGIYFSENNQNRELTWYSDRYNTAVRSSTNLACFPSLYVPEQQYWLREKKLEKGLHNRVLEPFYLLEEGDGGERAEGEERKAPWSVALHTLENKRILVVSPFAESFRKQVDRGFTFYSDDASRCIFHPSQTFVFYKAFNTQAGNHPHTNWSETFKTMCNDIKELHARTPFDVALLGCGGYGLPLANFIYGTLRKSAIYVGGGLQLLFGVSGKRWENHSVISRVAALPGNKWTRPSGDEVPERSWTVEGGCYW